MSNFAEEKYGSAGAAKSKIIAGRYGETNINTYPSKANPAEFFNNSYRKQENLLNAGMYINGNSNPNKEDMINIALLNPGYDKGAGENVYGQMDKMTNVALLNPGYNKGAGENVYGRMDKMTDVALLNPGYNKGAGENVYGKMDKMTNVALLNPGYNKGAGENVYGKMDKMTNIALLNPGYGKGQMGLRTDIQAGLVSGEYENMANHNGYYKEEAQVDNIIDQLYSEEMGDVNAYPYDTYDLPMLNKPETTEYREELDPLVEGMHSARANSRSLSSVDVYLQNKNGLRSCAKSNRTLNSISLVLMLILVSIILVLFVKVNKNR